MIVSTNNVEVVTNQATTEFELDNSNGQLFAVLSELYSKPVESTIREICTNCTDAHILSHNQMRPFIVKLPNYEKNIMNISFRDFGPGLNHQEIMNIYRVYGKSTKTKSNDVTGCLGLGSKSPYSISSTFYVRSYKDGKMSLYVCTMGNNGKPNITEEPVVVDTFEENGLEVVIPFYKEVDFISILKTTLKHFKVKPLIYTQQSELEQDTLIDIDWVPEVECIKLTDTIYIPEKVNNLEAFCTHLDYNRNCIPSEVIQLQIYYPLDKKIIMQTIERYNKLYTNEYNQTIKGYKIDDEVIKTIGYLFTIGFQFYASPGMIAFSPSREYIKYTDITLIYIVRELIKAAKIILRRVKSQYGMIKTKEDVFDKLIGRNQKYRLLTKYFEVNNNDVSSMIHEFDKEIPLNRLVGFSQRLSSYGNSKIKRYPANLIHSIKAYSDKTINLKNEKELIEQVINRKLVAMDVFDTTGKLVGGNDNVLLFSTYTNAFRDFVIGELNNYISYLINDIYISLTEAFRELFYNESDGILISSAGLVDGENLPRMFGLNLREKFKTLEGTLDRPALYDEFMESFNLKPFHEIYNLFLEGSIRSSIRSFKDSYKNTYSSKYMKLLYTASGQSYELQTVLSNLISKFDQPKSRRLLNFKNNEDYTIKFVDNDIKDFMLGFSPYFLKFALAYDINPSRFMKRVKNCTPNDYDINIWSERNLLKDEKIKEINETFLSGSILKIKILKHEINNMLLVYEAMMIKLLTKHFDIFKNQNLLGKADKFKLYQDELNSLQIPLKYCSPNPYETMVMVKIGASGKRISKPKFDSSTKIAVPLYTWDKLPSEESIIDLTLSANNLVKKIEEIYIEFIKDRYKKLKRELITSADPEAFNKCSQIYMETFKYGADLDTMFTKLLRFTSVEPENVTSPAAERYNLTWEKVKNILAKHTVSLDLNWENYNTLLDICIFLRRMISELTKKFYFNDLIIPSVDMGLVSLNHSSSYYTINYDDKLSFGGARNTVLKSFQLNQGVMYYSKLPDIKTLIFQDSKKFSVPEGLFSTQLDEVLEKHKVSLIIKGNNQKVNLGIKPVFKELAFMQDEKALTETLLRNTKKQIKDNLYGEKLTEYLWLFQEKNEYIYLNGMDEVFNSKQLKETYNIIKICLETLMDTRFNNLYIHPQNLDYIYSTKVWDYLNEFPALSPGVIKELLIYKYGVSSSEVRELHSSGWQFLIPYMEKDDVIDYFKENKKYLKLDKAIEKEYLEFASVIYDKAVQDLECISRICGMRMEDYGNDFKYFLDRVQHSYSTQITEQVKRFIEFRREMRNDISGLKVYEKLPAIPSRDDSGNSKIRKQFVNILMFLSEYNTIKSNFRELPNAKESIAKLVKSYLAGFPTEKETKVVKYKNFDSLIDQVILYKNKTTINEKINLRELIKKRKGERGLNAKTNLQLRKHRVF